MARSGRGRPDYNRVARTEDEELPKGIGVAASEKSQDEKATKQENGKNLINVVILDPAQNKFDVSVDPLWTVARLKVEGESIHKIPTNQQRLIFMGQLLTDDMILQNAKIMKEGTIIHLFPKPRVVVQDNNHAEEAASNRDPGGAHVPQIILAPDEAEMRSQILVLGSPEFMDTSNNVKLLSFLLLIMTSMELLALFTIILGVPPSEMDETEVDDTMPMDDSMHHPNHYNGGDVRTWRHSDYFDLALNLFGFYSAMLGIKATNESTRRLAFRYLVSTVICGILWNAFYYYLNFEVEQEIDKEQHKENESNEPLHTTKEYLIQAFFAILIPMMIWILCCLRAYQFHSLLYEAEREAEERIQSEIRMMEEGHDASTAGASLEM
jgi:Ubiquitin family